MLTLSNSISYKLVIVDYDMPVMNGFAFTKLLRQELESNGISEDNFPHIICLTSYWSEVVDKEA